jgi:hypothetical protein
MKKFFFSLAVAATVFSASAAESVFQSFLPSSWVGTIVTNPASYAGVIATNKYNQTNIVGYALGNGLPNTIGANDVLVAYGTNTSASYPIGGGGQGPATAEGFAIAGFNNAFYQQYGTNVFYKLFWSLTNGSAGQTTGAAEIDVRPWADALGNVTSNQVFTASGVGSDYPGNTTNSSTINFVLAKAYDGTNYDTSTGNLFTPSLVCNRGTNEEVIGTNFPAGWLNGVKKIRLLQWYVTTNIGNMAQAPTNSFIHTVGISGFAP